MTLGPSPFHFTCFFHVLLPQTLCSFLKSYIFTFLYFLLTFFCSLPWGRTDPHPHRSKRVSVHCPRWLPQVTPLWAEERKPEGYLLSSPPADTVRRLVLWARQGYGVSAGWEACLLVAALLLFCCVTLEQSIPALGVSVSSLCKKCLLNK